MLMTLTAILSQCFREMYSDTFISRFQYPIPFRGTRFFVTSGLLCGARYEREQQRLGQTRSSGNTALVEPKNLSANIHWTTVLGHCGSYLALRILRPSFHILDRNFVKQGVGCSG